jgi:hypothetical protein
LVTPRVVSKPDSLDKMFCEPGRWKDSRLRGSIRCRRALAKGGTASNLKRFFVPQRHPSLRGAAHRRHTARCHSTDLSGFIKGRLIGVQSHSGVLTECHEAAPRIVADSGMKANGRVRAEANGFTLLQNGVRDALIAGNFIATICHRCARLPLPAER